MIVGVGIGDDIDGKPIAIGEGVDMMEGEACIGRGRAHQPARVFLDDMEDADRAQAPSDNSG